MLQVPVDGVTLLDHQLMSYNGTNGDLQCWIKIPNLSTNFNTNIYMYYGNSGATTNPSSSNTWSNGYVGVWHFDNSLNNATATTGLNGTNNGTSNTTTAKFGSACNFASASSQFIEVTPYTAAYDITGNVCVSGWVRLASLGSDQKILGNQNNTNGGWKFGVFSDNKIEFEIRDASNSPYLSRSAGGGTTLGTGTWYYVVGQYSDAGDFIATYLNGALDRNYSTTAVLATSPGTMKFGREPFSTGAYLNGIQDETRLSNVIRSADWIATEYNNQNSPGPGSFYTVSSEPNVFIGASNANWSVGGNWSSGSAPTASNDVILTGVSSQPNLNADVQVGSLWIRPATAFNINNNRELSVLYDITNCGTITGGNGNSLVQLNSNSSATQNQYLSGSGTYSLRDLTINNTFGTNPAVYLVKDVSVADDLVLTSGIVHTTNTNILALGTGATSTSGSAASFISGPISKDGNSSFIFPVGKGNRWRRIRTSNLSGGPTIYRAEYFNNAYANTTPVNAPLNNVSTIEYWQLDRMSASGSANVTLYWESANTSGITDCPDLTVARWNGSSWDERAATTVGGSTCSGANPGSVATTAAVSAFSPFTFGSKLTTVNPLPVELLNFEGHCVSEKIQFDWSTATELHNNYFSIEFSEDGSDWKEIKQVKGSGTSSSQKNYKSILEDPRLGYYRLVQVDEDAKRSIFNTSFIDCQGPKKNNYSVFPNPATNEISLQFDLFRDYADVEIKIVDNLGRSCYEQKVNLAKGADQLSLPLNLAPGAYVVRVSSQQLNLPAHKLIIK